MGYLSYRPSAPKLPDKPNVGGYLSVDYQPSCWNQSPLASLWGALAHGKEGFPCLQSGPENVVMDFILGA